MRLLTLFCLCIALCSTVHAVDYTHERRGPLWDCFGTYDGEPRLANKHVDIDKLLSELAEQGANTYNWLIWHQPTDWEDLQAFLPRARKQNIKVWVTVCPPTESAPAYHDSEPFKQDYEKWAEEIGKLSAKEKNL